VIAQGDIILAAEGLTRHFGGRRELFRRAPLVRAVDGVDLAIRRGETFALVGESGCGKSTLARLLLRLIEPTSGKVFLEGAEVTALSSPELRALRQRMQIIFQDPYSSLNPRMTVGELVAEPIATHGVAEVGAASADIAREVRRMLDLVGLLPVHAERYPHEFSGGQRQRIGIARALASRPRLLIGDEPVSALDVSIRAQILNLLEDLKAELGLTLVLVSHDLSVVRHTANRVAVMYLGRIVEQAPVEMLFSAPRHPYTQALMAAAPAADPAQRRDLPLLEGDPPSPSNPPPGCRFHTRCAHAVDICRRDAPPLADIAAGHAVSCWRAADLALAGVLPVESDGSRRRRRIALFADAVARTRTTTSSPRPEPVEGPRAPAGEFH
jgi:oligopeptide/dipeptide ABC transporter ATP-binding protein